ncbi:MAG: pyridine nucleotide-disulfide oxidoreductase, partial [Spirochaeta sp. LUC14_002_19_P3]
VVNKIGYIASNLLEGQFNQVPFYDAYQLLKEKKQVIDVREISEYKAGHFAGTVNIPMGELRQRMSEIDKSKPVYVHCRTGERSYNVTMMLKSHGFDVYNIAGSYEFIKVYEEVSQHIDKNRENILVM